MSTTARESVDFHFRTKKGYKRPTVSVDMDLVTPEGIIELLQSDDSKVVELITSTVQKVQVDNVRPVVNDDLEFDQSTLDKLEEEGKTTLTHIAHIPKADRNVLSKDDLQQFAEDYVAIMPEATGKETEKVQAAAGLFVERFKRAAGDPQVLQILQDQLGVFCEAASDEVLERNERVITWAHGKLEELLSVKVTADAL